MTKVQRASDFCLQIYITMPISRSDVMDIYWMRGEVAHPILWRASGEVSHVTGSVLMVDGGQLAK
jgi:NAD(P)-dependent dehydrogenase (short-subunit alcohol dehydrogenase family)